MATATVRRGLWLAAFTVSASNFCASAQSVFGNLPTGAPVFAFVADGGIAGGGAVEFSLTQDVVVASVTVWLANYTGLDIYGQPNQSFYASIDNDMSIPTGPDAYLHQPGAAVLALTPPPPNNGQLAAFSFVNASPQITLHANTDYWLFIYEATAGGYNYYSTPQWISGSTPTGNGVYEGSEAFWDFGFSPSPATPSFAIMAVPEPSISVLGAAGALAIWLCRRRHRAVAVARCPRVPRPGNHSDSARCLSADV